MDNLRLSYINTLRRKLRSISYRFLACLPYPAAPEARLRGCTGRIKIPAATIITVSILSLSLYGCGERIPEQKAPVVPRTPLNIAIIADTMTYDVVIKNPNPDDLWTEESLSNLKRDALIDLIFDAIYSKNLVPYDFFSKKALSVKDIKRLEDDPEFSRENIGKIQFLEEWYFDEENLRMEKRVNSITLGYEVFNLAGELRGYKPAFLIELN
ncbi:MAG: hypothetical protein R6U58_03605 [Bacteroidales bacterium]